jgi:hypothetical protein
MAHKLLTDIEVQGEGLFNGDLTLGTASTFSKLVFDTSGFDTGEIEVGSFQAMNIDAQDGVFELMSNTSSQNHAIAGTMGGYVTLNFNGDKKLQTGNTGISITGRLDVSGDARVVGAFRDTGNSPGTSGQVLSSTVTGTSWITPSSGNVSGTGTTNNMTKWSNTTGGLADALMTDNGSTVTLSTNGSANTFDLFHTSGSGVALNIEKGGNDEGLIVNKTSGSGNAVSITGDSYFNGNVGIGEENPDTLLHLSGNSPTIKLEDDVASDYYNPKIEFFGSAKGAALEYISNPAEEAMQLQYYSIGSGQSTYLKLKYGQADFSSNVTGGATLKTDGVLQVAGSNDSYFSNGNVGIGTTNPTTKLEVQDGSIKLNSTSGYPSTNSILATWNGSSSPPMGNLSWHQNPGFVGSEWSHYKQSSPYTQARIRLIGDASSGGMFVNLNGSDVFTIQTSTGNVGIGTPSPSSNLEISDTTLAETRVTSYPSGGYGGQSNLWLKTGVYGNSLIALGDGSTAATAKAGIQWNDYNSILTVKTNSSDRLTIDNAGAVRVVGSGSAAALEIGTYGGKISSNYNTLETNANLKVNGAVIVKDLNVTPTGAYVGGLRYRTSGNNSYVDMCMQTGTSTYAWVNIITNSW